MHEGLPASGRWPRRVFVIACVLIILAGVVPLWQRLTDPDVLGIDDFAEYWAASRLNWAARNPYSPAELYQLQRTIGLDGPTEIMMWNPPWTLPLAMPFGLMSYPIGRASWLIIQLLFVIVSADLLCRHYGGTGAMRPAIWLLALTFTPTLLVLRMGQIAPIVLLGLVGFLHFNRTGQRFAAGACLVLATIKPHLVYLIGAAVLLWIVRERAWRVFLGAMSLGGVCCLIPLASNPEVFEQYWFASTNAPPTFLISNTLGALMRVIFAPDAVAVQFIFPVFGVMWLALNWKDLDAESDWSRHLPMIALASVITACYGWIWDQVILLIALIPMMIRVWSGANRGLRLCVTASYVILNLVDLLIVIIYPDQQLWHIWTAPALLLGWIVVDARCVKPNPCRNTSEIPRARMSHEPASV